MLLWWPNLTAGPSSLQAIAQNKTSRDQSTNAIRESIFQTMKAFLTGDVKTLKRLTAQRTLDLINLVYEAAREDPGLREDLRKARVTNSDEFLRFFMQGIANQYLQAAPMQPEQAARKVANDAVISFTNQSEARIVVGESDFARAKLAFRDWKIDLADSLKTPILREVKNPEMRARIKSL
jgi:hypothetical protein